MSRLLPLLCVCLLLILSGCAGTHREPPPEALQAEQQYREGDFAAAAEAFLRAAELQPGAASHYRLRAAESWRENADLDAAEALLGQIEERRLGDDDRPRLRLLRAELALHRHDYAGARRELDELRLGPAQAALRPRWLELRGRAAERQDPFFAARVYAELGTLLEGRERSENARRVRGLLAGIKDRALRDAAQTVAASDPIRSYLARALAARGYSVPAHLTQAPPPTAGGLSAPPTPRRVALLLPLSGPLAPAGAAVRDGFLAARFADPQHPARVEVIDAGDGPSSTLAAYRRAVADGVQAVVGPLTRDAVTALLNEDDLPIPVLALNRYSDGLPPGHRSFSLAPEEEGAAIAARLQQRDLARVVAVVGGDDAAQRALGSLRDRLERRGGQLLTVITVDDSRVDFQAAIHAGLTAAGLPTARPEDLDQPHDPGFDALFVAVRAPAARLLVPQLKLFGLSELPVLATSLVHAAGGDPRLDRDLSGVEFCDAPWLFDEVPGLPSRHAVGPALGVAGGAQARLFAFGMDAWRLFARGESMSSELALQGATGMLSVDEFGEVQREPAMAVFRAGRPQRVRAGELQFDSGPAGGGPQG